MEVHKDDPDFIAIRCDQDNIEAVLKHVVDNKYCHNNESEGTIIYLYV